MHITIWADGGSDIGYGHLTRTGALARELLQRGHEVTYATRTPDPVREVCPPGIDVWSLPPEPGSDAFPLDRTDVLVIDTYAADTEIQQALRDSVPLLVMIDDNADRRISCDVLVNGNLYASSLEYEWAGGEPTWCLGGEYMLLRDPFPELATMPKEGSGSAERAIVLMGGSDPLNTVPAVVRELEGIELDTDVIVGPGYTNRNDIERAVAATTGPFAVVENPDDLPMRMFEADVAVAGLGMTVYELLATRTPFVGVYRADNQRLLREYLQTDTPIEVLDAGAIATDLRSGVERLITSVDARREFHRIARDAIGGDGPSEVSDVVLDET